MENLREYNRERKSKQRLRDKIVGDYLRDGHGNMGESFSDLKKRLKKEGMLPI